MTIPILNRLLEYIKLKGKDPTEIDKKFISDFLPDSPVIVDCGAHIGTDSIQWAKIKGSKVYAFEPVAEIFKRLLVQTASHSNIRCFNLALSDYDGEAKMFISSGESDGSSSLLEPKMHLLDHPKVRFDKIEKVKCTTLDNWAIENNVHKVDLLWLDMQGTEQKMLMASPKILNTVSVIHTEVSLYETYQSVPLYSEFLEFLKEKNFVPVTEAIPRGYDMGNVLLIKKDRLQ